MCDCYMQKCKECDVEIPIHIADFKFPRIKVNVWCGKHIPKNRVTIFEINKFDKYDEEDGISADWKCGIRLCGGALEPSAEGVEPNIFSDYKITNISLMETRDAISNS